VRSKSDLEIPLAMAPGVVSHEVPFSSFPLGSEMTISSRGFAVVLLDLIGSRLASAGQIASRTSEFGVLAGLDLVEDVESVLDELRRLGHL
jgi:predicted dienelactone hydrolase